MSIIALTRGVSDSINECELTAIERRLIDVSKARAQHAVYEDALRGCGCCVERIPRADGLPDAVFVEDAAVVVPELAVIARPGAVSRREETASVERSLLSHRAIHHIHAPGTLDGGDVLQIGRTLFVGESARSNAVGIAQLRQLLGPYGYRVHPVPIHGCLHLKSAVTEVCEGVLLIQTDWIDPAPFAEYELIHVDVEEPHAANALRIGDKVIFPEAFPRTLEKIVSRGVDVRTVEVSELAKAEGAVTCCSLVFASPPDSGISSPW